MKNTLSILFFSLLIVGCGTPAKVTVRPEANTLQVDDYSVSAAGVVSIFGVDETFDVVFQYDGTSFEVDGNLDSGTLTADLPSSLLGKDHVLVFVKTASGSVRALETADGTAVAVTSSN